MIEVEIKLKIKNIDTVKSDLITLGFTESDTLTETDTYFDNKNGDIRKSDNALRIRETINHTTKEQFCQINFKGKKYDNKSMTRPEFETFVKDTNAITGIFNGLGYYAVAPKVVKLRRLFKSAELHACLDTVEGLGDYLELESVIEDESLKDIELRKINSILEKLGYSLNDTTTSSYLSSLQNLIE